MSPKQVVASTAAIAALLALCGAAARSCGSGDSTSELAGVPVRRGPLRISVVQRGNLEAKDSVSIQSEVEGQVTILHLVAEGVHVAPGDLLVELDVSDLADRKVAQEISVQNAEAAFIKAKQSYEIQSSENESATDTAVNAVQFAELDLAKYESGDWPQELQVAEEKIVLAEEEKARAEERLNWSKNLEEKGFITRTELEGDQLAFNRSGILLEQARREKELLIQYANPRQKKQLVADLEEARRELERTRLKAAAGLVDFEVARKTSEKKLALEEDKLRHIEEQIAKARIVAPIAGMVVYTRDDEGRFGGDGAPMQEGSPVRERQEILTIPREQGMEAEASVHESVVKQIVPGLRCKITVDALPGVTFDGVVQFVAPLPDKNTRWMNPDLRVFRTEVSIEGSHPDMRPGMSTNIEFLVDEVEDALFVPLQAILVHKGKTICFVDVGGVAEEREVEVGRSNDKHVEVVSGLREGELVLLSPPPGFAPQGSKDAEGADRPDAEREPGASREAGAERPRPDAASAGKPEGERGRREGRGQRGDGGGGPGMGKRGERSGERPASTESKDAAESKPADTNPGANPGAGSESAAGGSPDAREPSKDAGARE